MDAAQEKAIHLDEVKRLENMFDAHGVGNGNPEHPVRMVIAERRAQIERDYAFLKTKK
jgi:hypothetical protein